MCHSRSRRFLLASAVFATLPALARASTTVNATWLGATSGSWSDPTRWSSNPTYPNNDTPTPGTVYLATVNTPSATPYTVTLDTDVSVGTFTLSATGATFVQNANLTIGTTLARTAGTYSLAGGALLGNSPTSTPASVTGSISVPTLATPSIVGVNLAGATTILAPSSQFTITPPAGNAPTTYSTGTISLNTAGLPAKLVLLPPLSNGSGTPAVTGGSLLANPNAALITQSLNALPITFTGGNSNGAVYLTPDAGSIVVPSGFGSINTVIKGGPNPVTVSTGALSFKLTIEAGTVTSPTAPSGGTTISSRPDIGSVGTLVTSSLRPVIVSTSTGILSFDPGSANGSTFPGAFTQPGQTWFSSAPNRSFSISADSFSPGSDNIYRFGGNGGSFSISSPSNSPLLTGSSSLIVGIPRSPFGENAAPATSSIVTITGPNSYTGTTTINPGARLELGNSSSGITSPSAFTVDGTLAVLPTQYFNSSGQLSVRRGGALEIDASSFGSHDNFPDTLPVHLAGATLAYVTTTSGTYNASETVGTVYADAGLVTLNANATPTPGANPNLTINNFHRNPGSSVHVDDANHHNLGQSSSTSRIFLSNSSSLLVNNILPFASFTASFTAPQFLTYTANGISGTDGTTIDPNAAAPTMNVTPNSGSASLSGDRTINALRTYPSAPSSTLSLNGHLLTLTSGCLISTSASTISSGALTTTSPELFIHTSLNTGTDAPVTITSRITDSPAGPVSLVKDGSNTLVLANPFAGSVANTYTGGTYVNEGTLRTTKPLPTGPVFLSDSTLDLRSNTDNTLMVPGTLTASSSALAASTVNIGDAAAGSAGSQELRVSALTVSPDSILVLTRPDTYHYLAIDATLDLRSAVLRASNGASLLLGATAYYQDNASSALVNDPANPTYAPSFRFATGNPLTVNAVTRGTRLSAEPSSVNNAPTTLTYAGKLYSDNYDAELSATGNSKIIIDPAATLDTSRGFSGPSYDSHTLTLSGTGTVEFSSAFTLMQVANSKTLNDSGSAHLRLTGSPTFVTNSNANLPNYPSLPANLYAGCITFDTGAPTWSTRTNAQTYSQKLIINTPAILDTQSPLTLSGPITVSPAASLTKTGTSTLTLSPGTLTTPIPSLTITAGALDITSNTLTLAPANPTTTLDQIRQYLHDAHLTSSSANPAQYRALAYAPNPDNSITVATALLGDTNFDGTITPDDYALLDRSYAKAITNAHWTDGDFNYDGQITPADYILIDATYLQQQGGTPSPSFLATRESQFGEAYVTSLIAAVPEPSSLLAACGLALPLLTRRRASGATPQ